MNLQVKSIENDKERLLENNRVVAEENLGKEPTIIELRAQVNELADKGKELCSSVQDKLTQISEFVRRLIDLLLKTYLFAESKSGNLTQDTALALLQTAGAESEESSEKIVKQFLDSEITVEIFLEQFQSMRKIMHLRKIKADKMTELLRQTNIRGTGSPYPPAANTGFYPQINPMGGGVPYPMGQMMNMMPMAPTGYRNY